MIPRDRAPVPRKPSAARRALGDTLSLFGMLAAGIGLFAGLASTCAPTPAPAREPLRFVTHCERLGDTDATICETRLPGLRSCVSIVGGMDVPAVDCFE